ncbi:ankyrin repeat protein [Thraustotheca clavata]|uniref:Ankyrin repeat protein n=1 Tax=Thraustotheca clavata TaxID=74557 RepID=A0A1V9YTR9_9STRA|nr:ankyrin repeat protein [Thraustotheca clavata]
MGKNDLHEDIVSRTGAGEANIDGETPLYTAAKFGYKEVVSVLIATGVNMKQANNDEETPLQVATRLNHSEVVSLLNTALTNATQLSNMNTHRAIPESLLNNFGPTLMNPEDGSMALYSAVKSEHNDIVSLMILHKVKSSRTSENGDKPLHTATRMNLDEDTPLLLAIQNGYRNAIKMLISNGANVNQKDKYGRPLLFVPADRDNEEVVLHLLSLGANLNQQDKLGRTLFLIAAEKGHAKVVSYLVSKGVNVNQEKYNGDTALYVAAKNGHQNIIWLLLSAGADVNQPNEARYTLPNNKTSLNTIMNSLERHHFLLLNGTNEVVSTLICAGADVKQVSESHTSCTISFYE